MKCYPMFLVCSCHVRSWALMSMASVSRNSYVSLVHTVERLCKVALEQWFPTLGNPAVLGLQLPEALASTASWVQEHLGYPRLGTLASEPRCLPVPTATRTHWFRKKGFVFLVRVQYHDTKKPGVRGRTGERASRAHELGSLLCSETMQNTAIGLRSSFCRSSLYLLPPSPHKRQKIYIWLESR